MAGAAEKLIVVAAALQGVVSSVAEELIETSFAKRKMNLGYRNAAIAADGPLGRAGARLSGHEFHYATVVREGEGEPLFEAADATGASRGRIGRRRGHILGSFTHVIDVAR